MENVFVVSSAPVHISYANIVSTDVTTSEGFPVFANSVWQEAVADSAVADADWIEFSALVTAWKQETQYLSSLRKVFASPHYAKIIGMGRDRVVPLIARQLIIEGDTPYHWFSALHSLTNENPVPRFTRGDMKTMSKYWIEWARRRYGTKLDAT